MAKKKYYVVWHGYDTGVFASWTECQKQIKGFPGAQYKSYPSLAAATEAWENGPDFKSNKKTKAQIVSYELPDEVRRQSISVDAACSRNPGIMEYQGVDTVSKERLFYQGPFDGGTNNIGEFLALVHGIAYLQKKNLSDYVVYSDSRIAIGWVKKGKAKTTIDRNRKTQILFDLIARAEKWLAQSEIKVQIEKWDTKNWGEIPADFGRK